MPSRCPSSSSTCERARAWTRGKPVSFSSRAVPSELQASSYPQLLAEQLLRKPPSYVDPSSCAHLLRWCRDTQALRLGRLAHDLIIRNDLIHYAALSSLLLQMYEKCGSTREALDLFLFSRNQRDVTSCNFVLVALCRHGLYQEALQLFVHMHQEGILANKVTMMSIISACGSMSSLPAAKLAHVHVTSRGFHSDPKIGTALVNMYGKCDSMTDAGIAFDSLPCQSLVAYTIMISAYVQHGFGSAALLLFGEMLEDGLEPDRVTFISILAACSTSIAGKLVHTCIVDYCLDQAMTIANALISMYSKVCCLDEAKKVFDAMDEHDIITWTALISAYAEHENTRGALCLLDRMYREGYSPNEVTFLSLLSVFARQKAVDAGRRLYCCIVQHGFEGNAVIANAIINLYSKCGDVSNARVTFDRMRERSADSLTALTAVYAKEGEVSEAFRLFQQMEEQGVVSSKIALGSLTEACARQRSLFEGQKLHFYIIDKGFESDVILGTTLLKMYRASGNLEDVERVFVRLPERDQLTWDAMITSYVDDGKTDFALQLFGQMQSEAVLPDEAILVCLFGACADKVYLCQGVQLHACVQSNELNVVMATAIVNMYGRCGKPESASKMFDLLVERNVVLWTSTISAFIENGQGSRASQLFEQMLQECVLPNEVTFLNILKACANNEALIKIKWVHARIRSSHWVCDAVLGNALIVTYGKCGSINL